MSTVATTEELVAELYTIEGKAEILGGEIIMMSPAGGSHGRAAGSIYISLKNYESRAGGYAFCDNVGFLVDLPDRKSFSPDAAFYVGEPPGIKFLPTAPVFAAEIRSEGDYGPAAERQMAAKRNDYFSAGTKVVWDVDLLSDEVVRVYRADQPEEPTIYRKGEQAEAEPAVPGWSLSVDELFD
ncbi:MAG: Uma2 family endonuclease [Planctomycetes bacterium]|nr:Uma2 family endonuclease [Planctomycetota bacterium]